MRSDELVAEFRRKLCSFYGYYQNLRFTGGDEREPEAMRLKPLLQPRDFLDFAIEDSLALEKERNRVNCLTNSKRAIDSQVDRLIHRLGFLSLAKKERWNIPRKLQFISEIGIVAPRILRRLNTLRNRLEHNFALPSTEQVEDALDVTTLFVSYAELVQIPTLNWGLADKETVRYDYDEMVFHFFDRDPDLSDEEVTPIASLAYGEKGFQEFYDLLVRIVPLMVRKSGLGEDI